jgi:hypothetical protein
MFAKFFKNPFVYFFLWAFITLWWVGIGLMLHFRYFHPIFANFSPFITWFFNILVQFAIPFFYTMLFYRTPFTIAFKRCVLLLITAFFIVGNCLILLTWGYNALEGLIFDLNLDHVLLPYPIIILLRASLIFVGFLVQYTLFYYLMTWGNSLALKLLPKHVKENR